MIPTPDTTRNRHFGQFSFRPITYTFCVSHHTSPVPTKVTLTDLRKARASGPPMAMLTCYDYTTATHMRAAGVPSLLVGDSAASVILGHATTIPISLDFLIELTAAVRRGHPEALLFADMPFGSYHASHAQGMKNIVKMMQQGHPDAVKLEVSHSHLPLIRKCADAGVPVMAHIGLRPQTVNLLGSYKTQGRTPSEAAELLELAKACHDHGAAALLLEAVPSATAAQVVEQVPLPVIGCGAGPACHGHVVVTQDLLGLTPHRPKFVPDAPDQSGNLQQVFKSWTHSVSSHTYPAPQHEYQMATAPTSTTPPTPHASHVKA